MRKCLFTKLAGAAGLALAGSLAHAAPVYYTFEGTVSGFFSQTPGGFDGTAYLNSSVCAVLMIDTERQGSST